MNKTSIEVQSSYIKVLLVDREILYGFQDMNDAMMDSLSTAVGEQFAWYCLAATT